MHTNKIYSSLEYGILDWKIVEIQYYSHHYNLESKTTLSIFYRLAYKNVSNLQGSLCILHVSDVEGLVYTEFCAKSQKLKKKTIMSHQKFKDASCQLVMCFFLHRHNERFCYS